MAKVVACSSVGYNVPRPKLENMAFTEYFKAGDEYLAGLVAHCKAANPTDKYAGRIARFPVADGFATYVVSSLKPLKLVHVDIGDGWHYQYINRLNATDIKNSIDRNSNLAMR